MESRKTRPVAQYGSARFYCIYGWLGCVTLTSALAIVLLVLVWHHIGEHPGEARAIFGVDVVDRTHVDPSSMVSGRIGVDVERKVVCSDLFYAIDAGCDILSVKIKGPINDDEGTEPVNVIAEISGAHLEDDNIGAISATNESSKCVEISSANMKKLMKNPALNYVEVVMNGTCANGKYRDYLSAMVQNPEFKMSEIDDDDSHLTDDDDADAHATILAAHAAGAKQPLRHGGKQPQFHRKGHH